MSTIDTQTVHRWGGLIAIAAACLFGEVLVRLEERLSTWWTSRPTSEPAHGADR